MFTPERGARLGDFGTLNVSPTESWVVVGQGNRQLDVIASFMWPSGTIHSLSSNYGERQIQRP